MSSSGGLWSDEDTFAVAGGVVQYVAGAAGQEPHADVRADRVVAPLRIRDAVVLLRRALVHVWKILD